MNYDTSDKPCLPGTPRVSEEETHAVASGQSRRYFPADVHESCVPGSNSCADTQGLVSYDLVDAVVLGIRVAADFIR